MIQQLYEEPAQVSPREPLQNGSHDQEEVLKHPVVKTTKGQELSWIISKGFSFFSYVSWAVLACIAEAASET